MKTAVKTANDRPPRLSRQFLRDLQWVSDHWLELVEKYPNQWIAVHKGKVIAQGEEAFNVWHNAGKLGLGQPYLRLIEREIHVYNSFGAGSVSWRWQRCAHGTFS